MATNTLPKAEETLFPRSVDVQRGGLGKAVQRALKPLASLRLTVVLFAMSIFIVFVGTLAQVNKDIWDVVDQYFRVNLRWSAAFTDGMSLSELAGWLWHGMFAWVDFQVFFPESFFPSKPIVPGGIYFPKGWLIGMVMFLNLLAAHAVRFKIQARGMRLWYGLVVIAFGSLVTLLVVVGGSLQSSAVRQLFLDWPSLRILWQLLQGGLAGLILLAGCTMVFKRRGGIVLLHAGVGLMMLSELLVGLTAVEGQMQIGEGETVNYVVDIRAIELAVIDSSDPDTDDVMVIPQSLLYEGSEIHDENLPFDVQVLSLLQNSDVTRPASDSPNPATRGKGLLWQAQQRKPGAGTDMDAGVDQASVYVKLTGKQDGADLGTYLLSQVALFAPDGRGTISFNEPVEVDGKTYEMQLRFKRTYKPYSMHLVDVRFDKYMGTQKAKNYSSELRLVDDSRNVDREVRIWMNNPLRFAGETFYQSEFKVDPTSGTEVTGLQVVTNTGWMIPYVSCMIVATGMLAQFWNTLLRFLVRAGAASKSVIRGLTGSAAATAAAGEATRTASSAKQRKPKKSSGPAAVGTNLWTWCEFAFPLLIVGGFALLLFVAAKTPDPPQTEMQFYEAGKIPLVYEGRVKPLDTLARNALRIISDREYYVDESGKIQPAVRWLLDVIARPTEAMKHKVVRIENSEVQQTLGLERRERFRYAIEEFKDNMAEFEKQVQLARSKDAADTSTYEKKVVELDNRLRLYTLLLASFDQPHIRPDNAAQDLMAIIQHQRDTLSRMQLPLIVPPESPDQDWDAYVMAWTKAWAQTNMLGQDANPATLALNRIFVTYAQQDVREFNLAVDSYQNLLENHPLRQSEDKTTQLNLAKSSFEAFFNHFAPFWLLRWFYVGAFVLAGLAWIGWSRPLNSAALWLIALTFAVHTFALCARIYISGRPPVTNLYSSAVFIGWGAVALGIVIELVYRIGIGNVIAGVTGFVTLQIAYGLAGDGDTFTVLQAVLDTQFWLATHVTCITLGYSTTYVAGFVGFLYIVRGFLTPSLSQQVGQEFSRIIYGTICFALFFSFVGTVLGGLWADDSWGRFWGWDPKENGALIIVLWNALVLHARWGGMVRERGLAALAVFGNVVTSWSWFGVNELGVGLHSYGFTEGVLFRLACFAAFQMLLIGVALLPKQLWWSFRRRTAHEA